jgi:hypothetical protein
LANTTLAATSAAPMVFTGNLMVLLLFADETVASTDHNELGRALFRIWLCGWQP